MPSTSAIVNRALKMRVTPLLRKIGFDKVEARRAWHWRQDLVWVFTIRAIGGNLGDRIWPPSSVNVLLGVFYRFFPQRPPGPAGLPGDHDPAAAGAFSASLRGGDSECPCCRRRFADAG